LITIVIIIIIIILIFNNKNPNNINYNNNNIINTIETENEEVPKTYQKALNFDLINEIFSFKKNSRIYMIIIV